MIWRQWRLAEDSRLASAPGRRPDTYEVVRPQGGQPSPGLGEEMGTP